MYGVEAECILASLTTLSTPHTSGSFHEPTVVGNTRTMRSAIHIAVLILAVATARFVRAASDPRRTLKAEEPVVTEKVFFDITIGGEDSPHDLFVIYDNCGHRVGWEGGEGGLRASAECVAGTAKSSTPCARLAPSTLCNRNRVARARTKNALTNNAQSCASIS